MAGQAAMEVRMPRTMMGFSFVFEAEKEEQKSALLVPVFEELHRHVVRHMLLERNRVSEEGRMPIGGLFQVVSCGVMLRPCAQGLIGSNWEVEKEKGSKTGQMIKRLPTLD